MNTRLILIFFSLLFFSIRVEYLNAKDSWRRVDSLANIGNYPEALNESLKQLESIESRGSCSEMAFAYLTVGRQHYYLKQKQKAISWFQKSNKLSLECNLDSITGKNYRNIGAIYWEIGMADSSAHYLQMAHPYLKKAGMPKELATLFAIMFELHFRSFKDVKAGERMLDSCRKYSLLCKDRGQYAFYLMKKGIFLMETGACKEAQSVFREGEKIYRELNTLEGIAYALNGLLSAQAYCVPGSEILQSIRNYDAVKDQIFQQKTAENLARYEALFNNRQKQLENDALRQKNQWMIIIFFFALAVLVVLFLFVHRTLQAKKERKHQEKLRELQRNSFLNMLSLQEQERAGFAADLHDGIGHLIAALQLNLSALEPSDERQKQIVSNAKGIIDTAGTEVRQISHRLMPRSLLDLGPVASIRELVNRISVARKINIDFKAEEDFFPASKDFQIALYRIVQEVLSNMLQHAEATQIQMALSSNSHGVRLLISDNGKGFDQNELALSDGLGWRNIQSRVDLFKGKLHIDSKKNHGSTLIFEFSNFS